MNFLVKKQMSSCPMPTAEAVVRRRDAPRHPPLLQCQLDDFFDGGDLFVRTHDGDFVMRLETIFRARQALQRHAIADNSRHRHARQIAQSQFAQRLETNLRLFRNFNLLNMKLQQIRERFLIDGALFFGEKFFRLLLNGFIAKKIYTVFRLESRVRVWIVQFRSVFSDNTRHRGPRLIAQVQLVERDVDGSGILWNAQAEFVV